jgi:hypothetical protein
MTTARKNRLYEAPRLIQDHDLHERIAHLAYELYQERGCEDGHECEDWLEAERRVLTELESAPHPLHLHHPGV